MELSNGDKVVRIINKAWPKNHLAVSHRKITSLQRMKDLRPLVRWQMFGNQHRPQLWGPFWRTIRPTLRRSNTKVKRVCHKCNTKTQQALVLIINRCITTITITTTISNLTIILTITTVSNRIAAKMDRTAKSISISNPTVRIVKKTKFPLQKMPKLSHL